MDQSINTPTSIIDVLPVTMDEREDLILDTHGFSILEDWIENSIPMRHDGDAHLVYDHPQLGAIAIRPGQIESTNELVFWSDPRLESEVRERISRVKQSPDYMSPEDIAAAMDDDLYGGV